MNYTKLAIKLNDEELSVINSLAKNERRDTSSQAAWIIRQRLVEMGLLQPAIPPKEAADARQPA